MHYLEDLDRQENDLVGKVLCGKWRVLHRIGRGGMSTVYAAAHRNGRKVAVKVLRQSLAANKRIVARFLREGYVANKIRHPGAVAILDDDTDENGTVFLVMELLDGGTLTERYGGSAPASLGEVLRVGERLLDVLVAAHASGVVHRDIKPSNVFLTTDGDVMLLDFGIARLLETESETGSTHSGATLGTPGFMAPEQARGRGNLVDARTDVWAVGALLFFLLTGRTVHEAETPNELLIASATQPARSVGAFCPGVPESIVALVDRALEMDRERRWPDAQSMKDALEAARAAVPEPALARAVERASGMGGASTIPETHTAEPSVVSRRDVRGFVPQTPSTSGSRGMGALPWAAVLAVVAAAVGAAVLARPFEAQPVDPVSKAVSAPVAESRAASNMGAPATPPVVVPAATEDSEPPRAVTAAPIAEPASIKKTAKSVAERASRSALQPASTETTVATPAAAPSAALDILDLRR